MLVGMRTQPSSRTPLHTVEFWWVSVNCPCSGQRPSPRGTTRLVRAAPRPGKTLAKPENKCGVIPPELRAISGDAGPELVEDLDRQTARVRHRLQHERWDGADQDGLRDATGAVAADVTDDF